MKKQTKALEIIQNGRPTLVGLESAGEEIPGMRKDLLLHAGPLWEKCLPMRVQ